MLLFSILDWEACWVFTIGFDKTKEYCVFGIPFLKNLPVSLSRKKRLNLSLTFYFNVMLGPNIHLTFLNVYLFKKSVLGYCQELVMQL